MKYKIQTPFQILKAQVKTYLYKKKCGCFF